MFRSRSVMVGVLLPVLGAWGCGDSLEPGANDKGNDAEEQGGPPGPASTSPATQLDPPKTQPPPGVEQPLVTNPVLDAFVGSQLDPTRSPGIAAAIVKNGQLKWANGYGLAHIGEKRPATADTLFQTASVAKTLTAAVVMQLVEKGTLSLDAPITALPFEVQHPRFKTKPITVRSLLLHTSSILDPDVDLYKPGDTKISLERYLRGSLLPGGEYYKAANWASWEPGAKYEYSNTGVTLLGYLVQLKAGTSFEAYTKTNLFEPLRMTETAWRIADLDASHIAMPYTGSPGKYKEAGLYGYPDFPAGMLRTSVKQLSSFLRMMMNGGEVDGARVLKPETVADMIKVHIPSGTKGATDDQGFVWFHKSFGSRRAIVHDGSDPGVFTLMGWNPETKVGAIVLTNGGAESSAAADKAISALFERLLTEGESL